MAFGAGLRWRPDIPVLLALNCFCWHALSIGAPGRSSFKPDACCRDGRTISSVRAVQPSTVMLSPCCRHVISNGNGSGGDERGAAAAAAEAASCNLPQRLHVDLQRTHADHSREHSRALRAQPSRTCEILRVLALMPHWRQTGPRRAGATRWRACVACTLGRCARRLGDLRIDTCVLFPN